jgi:iron complex outermembrane recepter protein
MKKLIYSLLILLLSFNSKAQFSISGKVVSTMNEDIPFSTVLLLQKEDSSMIKGTISTEAGTYLFEDIATGNYFLQSSFVGFEKTFSPSFLEFDTSILANAV